MKRLAVFVLVFLALPLRAVSDTSWVTRAWTHDDTTWHAIRVRIAKEVGVRQSRAVSGPLTLRLEKALANYRKKPKDEELLFIAANWAYWAGRYEPTSRVRELLRPTGKSGPDCNFPEMASILDPKSYEFTRIRLFHQPVLEEILPLIDRLLERDPNDKEVLRAAIWLDCWLIKGSRARAVASAEKLATLVDPKKEPYVYSRLGHAYLQLYGEKKARLTLERSLECYRKYFELTPKESRSQSAATIYAGAKKTYQKDFGGVVP